MITAVGDGGAAGRAEIGEQIENSLHTPLLSLPPFCGLRTKEREVQMVQ